MAIHDGVRDLTDAAEAAEAAWDVVLGELQTHGFSDHAQEMLRLMKGQHLGLVHLLSGAVTAVEALGYAAEPRVAPDLRVVR